MDKMMQKEVIVELELAALKILNKLDDEQYTKEKLRGDLVKLVGRLDDEDVRVKYYMVECRVSTIYKG